MLGEERKLRVYAGEALTWFMVGNNRHKIGSVKDIQELVVHNYYTKDRDYDIAVGILRSSFRDDDPFAKPIALPASSETDKSKVCSEGIIVGMGKPDAWNDKSSMAIIYSRVRTYINADSPSVQLPLVRNFGAGMYYKSNLGGPLVCDHQGNKSVVLYGVIKPGQGILVERMIFFIQLLTGGKVIVSSFASIIGKVSSGLLVCEMILLIVK